MAVSARVCGRRLHGLQAVLVRGSWPEFWGFGRVGGGKYIEGGMCRQARPNDNFGGGKRKEVIGEHLLMQR